MSVIKRYAPEIGPGFNPLPVGAAYTQVIERRTAVFPLTAAQLISMGTTPITVIPAPGTGQAIVVDLLLVELALTSTAFTSGGVVHFYYHGQTTEIMAQTIAAATVTGGAGTTLLALSPAQTAGGSVVTKEVGVDITSTAAFASGTGTAKVFADYHIVTL